MSELPALQIEVPANGNVMTSNGEVSGAIGSFYTDKTTGAATAYETGNYYAVLSGSAQGATGPAVPSEVVGIIVVTSQLPQNNAVTTRETGGFILVTK
ncbi:hypothetical protein GALL_443850 [mine drainage metagenome]|uniref:Uncharacterized protein n=1 Tax=mine drainage metagenome TaxID=410659 RepID=A0A1J5PT28_9ZZZZ